MLDKLEAVENRFDEVTQKLADPMVLSRQDEYRALMKEHADLEELVGKYREYKALIATNQEHEELLKESGEKDFCELVESELKEGKEKLTVIQEELRILLIPKDPNDERGVIVEIRGGAGGDEAALFAGDLFRMYTRYAEKQRWRVEMMDSNPTELGGFKEVIFSIDGRGAYSRLKFESGVHRVQRIPTTEAGGRIHTSTVTVAVLAEVDEVEVDINPSDLRIDTYRASGAGGQHINKTESAIRITHIPTGFVVTCQDERSQFKNKDKAMKILRSKLFESAQEQQDAELAQARKSQVGTGDRSERIRTYNFPQGRVTDHRIGLTLHRLDTILEGDIDEIINALVTTDQSKRLSSSGVDDDE